MAQEPIAFVVYQPRPDEAPAAPHPDGRPVVSRDTMEEACAYLTEHDVVGRYRICQLFNGPDGEPIWRRLTNEQSAVKARCLS
jgi:hypothetical protein